MSLFNEIQTRGRSRLVTMRSTWQLVLKSLNTCTEVVENGCWTSSRATDRERQSTVGPMKLPGQTHVRYISDVFGLLDI